MLATLISRRHKNSLQFLALRTISNSGNALNSLIAPLLTYKVFGSLKLMGLAFAIEWLPRVFSSMYSGQLVQRFGPHKLYGFSELIRSIAFMLMVASAYFSGSNQMLAFGLLLLALPLVQAGAGVLETISEESAGHAVGDESLGQTICRVSDKFARICVMPVVGLVVYLTNDTLLPAVIGAGLMAYSWAYVRSREHLLFRSNDTHYHGFAETAREVWKRKDQLYPTIGLMLLTVPMAMQWSIIPLFLGMDPQNPQSYRDFSIFAAVEACIVIFGVSTLLNRENIPRKITWIILLICYVVFMLLCLAPFDRVLLAAAHIGWVMSVMCIGILVRIERQEKLKGAEKATFAGFLGAIEYTGFVIGGLIIALTGSPTFVSYTIPTLLAIFFIAPLIMNGSENE